MEPGSAQARTRPEVITSGLSHARRDRIFIAVLLQAAPAALLVLFGPLALLIGSAAGNPDPLAAEGTAIVGFFLVMVDAGLVVVIDLIEVADVWRIAAGTRGSS